MLRSSAGRFISPALRAASRGGVESRALLFQQRPLPDGLRVAASSGPVPGVITGSRVFSSSTTSGGPDKTKEQGLDLGELDREIERTLKQQAIDGEKGGGGADFKSYPADERGKRARRARSTQGPFNWGTFYVIVVTGSICTAVLLYMAKRRREERDRMHKRMIGRANIGGEWELVNCVTGEVEGSKDLAGSWLLIYFGFTHCPDICPEQIEKMVRVVDSMQAQKVDIPIVPLFLSVDPQRDSAARVKTYCEEFSPKLRGYTGSKEQVEKVTRAFRVYYSPGPKTEQALQGGQEDYIVDHTVVMYLVDPDGQFADYFGQNRNVDEIVNAIRMKQTKRELNTVRARKSLFSSTPAATSAAKTS